MEQLDYKKDLKEYYAVTKNRPVIIDVPTFPYIVVSGTGDPNTSDRFQSAIEALFSISYTLKFTVKRAHAVDYKVMPLTGWWSLTDPGDPDPGNRDNWAWTVGIQQPEMVGRNLVDEAKEAVRAKKPNALIDELRFESVTNGLCAQILHVGPFADEESTFEKLGSFIRESGYRIADQGHCEIYLSDFRRTAPDRLKTILRKKVVEVS